MKLFIAILLFITSSFGFASEPVSGSKSAYQYDISQKYTKAPNGYSAFYINHIGRHGSRYISGPKYEEISYQILKLADDQKQLTPAGLQLLSQIESIIALNKNNHGALSELGRQDITKIGKRVLANNPTVFKGNRIEILSTTSPRAIESAEVFLQPFKPIYPDFKIEQQPEDAQTMLRFFEYSPAYSAYKESKSIKDDIKSMEKSPKTKEISLHIASKIFTDKFILQLNEGIKGINKGKIKTHEFAIALFAVYQELLSFTPEMLANNKLDFDNYFTESDKEWLTTVITTKNYLQIGPAFDANGIQIKIAAPLLWNIIHTSDHAIIDNTIDANFRFAHAETVSPLATLLELDGTTKVTDTLTNYPTHWKAEKIIPMGANIQFIFYRSEKKTQPILVKVLLNEKESHLPILTQHYPYYNWEALKAFYTNKLITLGLTDNQ